ncbi:VC2046/SO_2500 family protein [Shewanella sp. 5_MG-2023]|uniref:VC2046/SO_2500 family protein n=1 Tax=Shewanella sp. 5_MG-2023 TaxID=3062656 RepID=UPI0026E1B84D|nr:VC2046/SO_2500 family protein [Shewanella sp. 5_MG-2023]MDO6640666.1 VC2046/SO_2500 family protein [Shewanella sp. 5_MG-2023]
MQIESPLVNELQLGNRLNDAVEHHRRGEFALLLSMLSNDACDMAQFQVDKNLSIDEKLYKQLHIPKPQALVCDISQQQAINHAGDFYESGLSQFHLQQALKPEAVVTRGKYDKDLQITLANCDLLTKLKHQQLVPDTSALAQNEFLEQLTIQRKMSETLASQLYAVA